MMSGTFLSRLCIFIVLLSSGFLYPQYLSDARGDKTNKEKYRNILLDELNHATFGGLSSENIKTDCMFRNRSICCNAVDSTRTVGGIGIHEIYDRKDKDMNHNCKITFSYIPSQYENFILSSAESMTGNLLYYYKDKESIKTSLSWLKMVKELMIQDDIMSFSSNIHSTTYKKYSTLLSQYKYIKTCPQAPIETWIEWIEPLSFHARHPLARVSPLLPWENSLTTQLVDLMSIDYILLQSGKALNKREKSRSRHILLDAGSSTFQSSLWYFTCAYLQRGVGLHHIYAWEATPMDPKMYWSSVPSKWLPYLTLYNLPIHPSYKRFNSPLRLLLDSVHEDDFVAFKLDITAKLDTRIFFHLLSNPSLSQLIDEFFFEFHFESEIMSQSGWGHTYIGNLSYALKSFQNLRKRGIRAHFWP